jgi:SAM-dependent methyltransferase
LCKSTTYHFVSAMRDRLLGIEGQFTMVRCADCGLHYLNPQPTLEELERYYPSDYDPFTMPLPTELPLLQRWSVNYGLHKRVRAVTQHKKEGRLLEIGCANGLFLHTMRKTGRWRVQGVDVSEPAVRYARERLELDVFQGELQAAHFPSGAFDAVVMWDVLEHLHDPIATLCEAHRLLGPGGMLFLRVPLLDSWDRSIFGSYWAGWDAPRHLAVFSIDTLKRILTRAGFDLEQITCISGSYPAFALSVRFWARDHLSERGQRALRRVLDSLPIRLVTSPYFYLVDRLVKSTVATVTAVPRPAR